MRKILIGTPVKGGLSPKYLAAFLEVLRKKAPDLQLEYCFHAGASVNFARNDIANFALAMEAREILFIDEDMDWNIDYFLRILSHVEVDIVAGLYCKKIPGQPAWLTNALTGAVTDPTTGLCEVKEIATGFMKIRVDTVLKAMVKAYPEREYYAKAIKENGEKTDRDVMAHEFFPMGVLGPRSAEARLERIKLMLDLSANYSDATVRRLVYDACHDEQSPGNLFGEDYYFCRLARACGFKIYADLGMAVVGHIGPSTYPITPAMVGLNPNKDPHE